MKHTSNWILPSAVAVMASSCAADAVVFSTYTVVGVDIQAAEAGSEGVKVGYSRQEFVSMPVREVPTNETEDDSNLKDSDVLLEAYPVLSISSMDTGRLFSTEVTQLHVRQVFATGAAATQPGSMELIGRSFGGLVGADLLDSGVIEPMVYLHAMVQKAPADKQDDVLGVIDEIFANGQGLDITGYQAFLKRHYKDPQLTEMLEDAQANAAAGALTEKEVALQMIDWAAATNRTDLLQQAVDRIKVILDAGENGD